MTEEERRLKILKVRGAAGRASQALGGGDKNLLPAIQGVPPQGGGSGQISSRGG